jgi:hypothetical protein
LYWNENYRLHFADFRGRVPTDPALAGASSKNLTHLLGGISKSMVVLLITRRNSTVFTIYAGMNKDSSWIKNKGDSITLKHEQGHFDICELYARLLRRDIRKAGSLKGSEEIYNRILADEESAQESYDRENTFGSGGIRLAWKDSISNRLSRLGLYKNPRIVLPISR